MFNSTEISDNQAERFAPSGVAFGAGSENLGALDSAITKLEAAELLARRAESARVEALAEVDLVARMEAAAEVGSKASGRAAEDSLAYRAARAEAATALHLSEQATERHLARAATLTRAYAETIAALSIGEISMQHASVILDAGSVIGPIGLDIEGGADDPLLAHVSAKRAAYEARVLAEAVRMTPNLLRPIARRLAESFALEDLDTRHERERMHRTVWVTEREEGMAELGAYLPAHEAYAIYSRLTQMAKRAEQIEARRVREAAQAASETEVADTGASTADQAEPVQPRRTRGELRLDLFTDLLLNGTGDTATGGPGSGTGIAGIVQLITHDGHLDGSLESIAHDLQLDLPLPEMEGYGPIPISMARDIAADGGTWCKVNVSLQTGSVITVDRYTPSAQIRRFLTARDRRCRFPGCRVPLHRCDFDHTVDAALGGLTSTDNLGALCRNHHLLKHHTGWSPEQRENGDYDWTSPTGRTHIDEPVSRVRFVQVSETEPKLTTDPPDSRPEGTAPPETEHEGTAPSEIWAREDVHPF